MDREISNSFGMEILRIADDTILPGNAWPLLAQRARAINSRFAHGEGNGFYTLGVIVAGAALASELPTVDIETFASAVVPPLDGHEKHGFEAGIYSANYRLMQEMAGAAV